MNPLLPFSILGSLILAGVLLVMTLETAAAGPRAGLGLLTGLAVLGVVEHVFLVLPVPLDRLWTWGLRSREKGGSRPSPERDRIPPQALSIQVTQVR